MTDLRIPNAEACLRILRQTPGTLRHLLTPATVAQMNWRPPSGRWSIAMVLAHLADAEVRGFQQRFQAMLSEDLPTLPSYDQTALFEGRSEIDPHASLARFEQERAMTLGILE